MRIFGLGLLAALAVCCAIRVPATAVPYSRDEPSGSYTASCVSIQMHGPYLYAKCQAIDGSWHESQLDTDQCPGGPVANNNATLVCGPGGYGISNSMPRGTWRASCRDARKDSGTLYARCDTGSGSWRDTSLDLDDCPSRIIDNSRGNLVCRSGGAYGFTLPQGSWRTTCRNGSMDGPVVFAECNNGSGSWQSTSFDLRNCPSRALGNRRGNLVCEGPVYRHLEY